MKIIFLLLTLFLIQIKQIFINSFSAKINKKTIYQNDTNYKNLNNSNTKSKNIKEEEIVNISNYNYPKKQELKNDEFLLTILGTNDIHGQAYGRDISFKDNYYSVGGYKLLSAVINIIKEENKDSFLWFDAGDQFTGTVENIYTKGNMMVDFYNAMKVDSVALGNHEWDMKEEQLRKWMTEERGRYYNENEEKSDKAYKGFENFNNTKNELFNRFLLSKSNNNKLYIAANLILKNRSSSTNKDLPNKLPYKIFKFLEGKIKIGVIGLTTTKTVQTTRAFPSNKFSIEDYKSTIIKNSKELREKGAQAILIVSHVGMNCDYDINDEDNYFKLFIKGKDTETLGICRGEIFDLINSLDDGLIDGVISGHIHQTVNKFINGIPVIQNPGNTYTNLLYLKFKEDENGNYKLLKEEKLIEGPIPLCSKVFSHNYRCDNYDKKNVNNLKISEFIFHNKNFMNYIDSSVEKVFENYKDVDETIKKMKKNIVMKTEVKLHNSFTQENILGNFIADIYKKITKSDIGMLSPGNIRNIWEKGPISEYEFRNMFPFGGNFSRYNVTGKNLKKIIYSLQQSNNILYSFSGINMTLIKHNETYFEVDKDKLVLENGKKIDDNYIYSFSSGDFMLLGGDDMRKFVENGKMTINSTAIENSYPITQALMEYMKAVGNFDEEMGKNYLGKIVIKDKNLKSNLKKYGILNINNNKIFRDIEDDGINYIESDRVLYNFLN